MEEILYTKIQEAAQYISNRSGIRKISKGIILGTGMGDFSAYMEDVQTIPYDDIPYFIKGSVESHSGHLVTGYIGGMPLAVLSGRLHYYEGYSAKEVTFPVRVLQALGIKELIITNAAGAVNPHFEEGDLVLISDHINLQPDHPLRGENDMRLGLRFPDMMCAYDTVALDQVTRIASDLGIGIRKGVYLSLQGPSLETPAEYRMANILGADLVGMSTVPEVLVARHGQTKVLAVSVVSNVCFPKSRLTETTVQEVISVVKKAADKVHKLLVHYIKSQS
jgi:purine-nucleoside phosphorylase